MATSSSDGVTPSAGRPNRRKWLTKVVVPHRRRTDPSTAESLMPFCIKVTDVHNSPIGQCGPRSIQFARCLHPLHHLHGVTTDNITTACPLQPDNSMLLGSPPHTAYCHPLLSSPSFPLMSSQLFIPTMDRIIGSHFPSLSVIVLGGCSSSQRWHQ